jgi:hypothetical protein
MKRLALAAFLALVLPQVATAQIVARVFHPPGVSGPFVLGTPIPIVVQFTSLASIITDHDPAEMDLLSGLYFAFDGGIVTYTGAATAQRHIQPVTCLSLGGTLAVPAVRFSGSLEQSSPDIRTGYNLSRARLYNVTARFPLSTFAQVNTHCEKFPASTEVVNVGPGATGRQELYVVSNTLQVQEIYKFSGFASPVGDEKTCSLSPCHTFTFGDTVPMKFQLSNASGAVITPPAVARISVEQVSGTPPPKPPKDLGQGSKPFNQYRFDQNGNNYVFNLDTKVLAPGVWRVHTKPDDGTDHPVLIQLK